MTTTQTTRRQTLGDYLDRVDQAATLTGWDQTDALSDIVVECIVQDDDLSEADVRRLHAAILEACQDYDRLLSTAVIHALQVGRADAQRNAFVLGADAQRGGLVD